MASNLDSPAVAGLADGRSVQVGSPTTARVANLDLLRALAISLVVVFHVVQMWPTPLPGLARFTALGAFGVDLFFVLSGWLVGGLFWKERARSGAVDVRRFVLRRVLRTVPCYFVALALSWLAVVIAAPERAAFDWRYLVFGQNYLRAMPYFLVSWSLCIEEHFYLAMPLCMLAVVAYRPRWISWLWPLCLLPMVLRWFEYSPELGGFGYGWTATHLRFEGLLAGVLAAGAARDRPEEWNRLRAWALPLGLIGLASGTALFFASSWWFYVAGLSLFAFGFLFVLVSMVAGSDLRPARVDAVKAIALGSYSAYLTHALLIHAARSVIARLGIVDELARAATFVGILVGGAALFYLAIERPAMALRDRLVPSPSF